MRILPATTPSGPEESVSESLEGGGKERTGSSNGTSDYLSREPADPGVSCCYERPKERRT